MHLYVCLFIKVSLLLYSTTTISSLNIWHELKDGLVWIYIWTFFLWNKAEHLYVSLYLLRFDEKLLFRIFYKHFASSLFAIFRFSEMIQIRVFIPRFCDRILSFIICNNVLHKKSSEICLILIYVIFRDFYLELT